MMKDGISDNLIIYQSLPYWKIIAMHDNSKKVKPQILKVDRYIFSQAT